MYEITVISDFSAAHRLRDYKGDCENLHGHNWRVEVSIESQGIDSLGMVMDFKVLKKEVRAFLGRLDHTYLNDIEPFNRVNPSSENLARFIFDGLSKRINRDGLRVKKVTVWESDDAHATYYE